MSNKNNSNTIPIIVVDDLEGVRGLSELTTRKLDLDVNQLAVNVNLFISQMNQVMAKTPEKVGKFRLAEFEVSAEINGKGQVILLGTGGEIGMSGGLKFVFKRDAGAE